MDELTHVHEHQESVLARYRFMVLIVGTVFISLVLVAISLYVYQTSGAAQLDLSRPGYRSVSSQTVNNDSGFTDYPETGPITQSSINQFNQLYGQQAQSIVGVDSFGGDPLNANTLEYNQPITQQ